MDEASALRAQIEALTAAVQALTAQRSTSCGLGDGTLAKLLELHKATWPEGATWRLSRRATLRPAASYFGERPARALTKKDWTFFRDQVRAKTVTLMKSTPAPMTLNYELACWRAVHRWAIAEGLLAENPLVGIKPLKAKKHRETETTDDDVRRMRAFIDDEGWAYALLYQRRGLRAVESRKLEWVNVDLDRGRVSFMAAKTRVWTEVFIPSDVVEALCAIRPEVPGRYVFPSHKKPGQPCDATTLWRKWRLAADAAGLKAAPGDRRARPHDSRHGFTSNVARKNPIAVAMRLSRHAGYRSAQRYIHCNEDDLELAHQKLEDARRPPVKVNPEPVGSLRNPVTTR